MIEFCGSEVKVLFEKCKMYDFIEYSKSFEAIDTAISLIQNAIINTQKIAKKSNLFKEIDELNTRKRDIQGQIYTMARYKKEYSTYNTNLNKSADSLQPIEFLNEKLSDQLVESYETKAFVESLESSLKKIKEYLFKKNTKPIKVDGNVKELEKQLVKIDKQIDQLNEIKKNYQAEGGKFITLGEIKFKLEELLTLEYIKPIDNVRLNTLNEEQERLTRKQSVIEPKIHILKDLLNESIQRNYSQLKSLPAYKNYRTVFDDKQMVLKLYPPDNQFQFPLDNVGSKSNYMFMHLCVFLGLHGHMINVNSEHVPQFLFIDQPSIPYYSDLQENDDKSKLIDAFTLLNSFIGFIVMEKKNHFQIFMVEHAPKSYWTDNN